MGLIKDFLQSKKEQKNANLNLEEENIALKQEINKLKNQIKEIEYLHAEEITALDREFLHWYNTKNSQLNTKTDSEKRGSEQEQLDLETKTEELNIEELINE